MKAWLCLIAASWTQMVLAAPDRRTTFMPENQLWRQDAHQLNSQVTEARFQEIINQVSGFYAPLAAAHGAKLTVDRKWTDATVNAYAEQDGDVWKVTMFGGLARRDEVTPDGFALVVCHELGHHFGGFPFYDNEDWAASEGQSDYFATQVCAKKIWAAELAENARYRSIAPAFVQDRCNRVYPAVAGRDLCYRSAMAGLSLAQLLSALGSQAVPTFERPDPKTVAVTNVEHPRGQCRLDTYFQGALCPAAWTDSEIPGRGNADGQESLSAERAGSARSCTVAGRYTDGLRPRCWYAPKLTLRLAAEEAAYSEISGNGNDTWEPGEIFGVNIPLVNDLMYTVAGANLSVTPVISPLAPDTAMYPEINPGQSAYASTPIAIMAPAMTVCGSEFLMKANVSVDGWQEEKTFSVTMGRLEDVEALSNNVKVAIPDDDQRGIESVLSAGSKSPAERVIVSVDISHSYIGDLIVSLIAPNGIVYPLHTRTGGTTDGLKRDYEVKIPATAPNGQWILKVADLASADRGVLNSWGLHFANPYCEDYLN